VYRAIALAGTWMFSSLSPQNLNGITIGKEYLSEELGDGVVYHMKKNTHTPAS
jgi:hypothetical protein